MYMTYLSEGVMGNPLPGGFPGGALMQEICFLAWKPNSFGKLRMSCAQTVTPMKAVHHNRRAVLVQYS